MAMRKTVMVLRTVLRATSRSATSTAWTANFHRPSHHAFSACPPSRPSTGIQRHDIYRSAHRHAFSSASKARPEARTNGPHARSKGQQKRHYGRPMFNQTQFQTAVNFFKRWAAQPTFYIQVAGLSGGMAAFYAYNLETVPVSGRRRFNALSAKLEKEQGLQQYRQVLQTYRRQLMPKSSQEHRMVHRVLQRLLPHSGLEGEEWEVHVIDDEMKNAFVIPGGKVFVFRGILDVCQGDDGLAAVLGHEIAHNVAHHAAERMSKSFVLSALVVFSSLFGVDVNMTGFVGQIAFSLPGSREQEQEADYIGLLMMAESCYDPEAAMGLWSRMKQEEKKTGGAPPQFLSTHPSSHNRLEKIRGWLPLAEEKMAQGGCSNIKAYVGGFADAADLERFGLRSGRH